MPISPPPCRLYENATRIYFLNNRGRYRGVPSLPAFVEALRSFLDMMFVYILDESRMLIGSKCLRGWDFFHNLEVKGLVLKRYWHLKVVAKNRSFFNLSLLFYHRLCSDIFIPVTRYSPAYRSRTKCVASTPVWLVSSSSARGGREASPVSYHGETPSSET